MKFGIRGKLLAGFAILLALMLPVGFVSWRDTTNMAAESRSLYQNNLLGAVQLANAENALWQLRYGFPQFIVLGDDARRQIVADEPRWYKVIDDNMRTYAAGTRTTDEQQALREWDEVFAKYVQARPRWFELYGAGMIDEAAEWRAQTTTPYGAASVQALQRLIDLQRQTAAEQGQLIHDTAASATARLVGLIAIALVLGIGLAWIITRNIVSQISRLVTFVEQVATGNLSGQAEVTSRDELGVLATHLNHMTQSLRELAAQTREEVTSLGSSKADILSVVSQQSSASSEQAAAIAQTTATVDQVRASAEQAAQMATAVAESAEQTRRVASEGVRAAHEATDGMADIRQKVQSIAENILALSEQSQQIGEIIAVVNDLADQSNLLALNAAIEASRAGEHGKGFAVVAAEIRSLAERSKGATDQVRTILSDIQRATNAAVMVTEQGTKGVDAGTLLIDQAGQSIDELAEAIQQSAESAHRIVAAVRQHSVGMEQIAAAMSNINQAASVSLTAANNARQAGENLDDLAGRLDRLVAQYQV